MRAEFRVMMSFLLMYDIKKKKHRHTTNKQTNNNNNNNKKTKTKQVSYSLTPTVMN